MVLKDLPPAHLAVVDKWLKFSQDHREALLKGRFTAHHPEMCYPVLEGESASERVVVVYSDAAFADLGSVTKPVYLVNATGAKGLNVELAAKPKAVELFDVFGQPAGTCSPAAGLARIPVPASGHAKIVW